MVVVKLAMMVNTFTDAQRRGGDHAGGAAGQQTACWQCQTLNGNVTRISWRSPASGHGLPAKRND